MKKIITAIVVVLLLAALGILGFRFLGSDSPRRHETTREGNSLVTEKLGWYRGSELISGKLIRPCDSSGTFDESFGARPLVMFVHDPMKVSAAEKVTKQLVPMGVIGYIVPCPDKAEDIVFLIRKMAGQEYADKDRIFLVADSFSSDKVVNALIKAGRKTAGAILLEPQLQGKAALTVERHGAELLVVAPEQEGNALELITDYMEERGAFK
ncbi:MAG: hypothetical protein ACI4TJ_08675 [Candidatus Cryptobacteroides sp.]